MKNTIKINNRTVVDILDLISRNRSADDYDTLYKIRKLFLKLIVGLCLVQFHLKKRRTHMLWKINVIARTTKF